MTGIDDPYEVPEHADLVLATDPETVAVSGQHVLALVDGLERMTDGREASA